MAVKNPPGKTAARQPRAPREIPKSRPKPPRNNERFAHDLWGVALVALGLILLVSLFVGPRGGAMGDGMATGLRALVGVGAFVVPFLVAAIGVMLISGREQHTRANFAGGASLLFVVLISWWHLGHTTRETQFQNVGDWGGYVGALSSAALRSLVGDISTHILFLALSFVALLIVTDMRLLHIFDKAVAGGKRVTGPVASATKAGAGAVKGKIAARKEAPPPASPRTRPPSTPTCRP